MRVTKEKARMYADRNCPYVYKVSAIERVVDGDTVDLVIDLGFDVCTRQRVRLLGIDTPESRTRDPEEKQFGLLAKAKLKEWCLKAVESDKDDIELELRCEEADSRGKFGRVLAEIWVTENGRATNVNRWLCENNYAVPYAGQNKADVDALHLQNREKVRHELELLKD